MPTLPVEILHSIHYRESNGLPMPVELKTRAFKAAGDYGAISADYHDRITQALIDYFEGGNLTSSRNNFKKGMAYSFSAAFDLGWVDGGADFPVDSDASDWLAAREETELGYIDSAFQQAKALKAEANFDYLPWVSQRADGYVQTLSSIYAAGKMWANKNQMLTWVLGTTEQHCATCSKLAGGRHRASWYIARDYIPQKPGAAMDCGGYYCDCDLQNDQGESVML